MEAVTRYGQQVPATDNTNTQQTTPTFSTLRHAARITGVSAATIVRWEKSGYIRLHRVNQRVLVDVAALHQFIRAH